MEPDPYELFRRGTELLAGDHAHQSATVLERAHRLLPGKGSVSEALGRAHYGLALCLARVGEPTLAAGHLRLALAMRPDVAVYQEALARVTAGRPRSVPGATDHRG